MNNPKTNNQTSSLNRRGFMKTSSAAIAGGAIVSTLPTGKGVFAASDDKLKIALIGCGGRGSGAANQALNTADQGPVELVAMADAFGDRLDSSLRNLEAQHGDKVKVTEETKFVGFEAYKKAISLADVVILATPPGFRPTHFEEAVRQGKHVFMEKPVAVDAPGVRKVLAAAKEAKEKNLKVGVGLQRHHQQGYIETIKRLHDGAIGDITSMRCYWNGAGVWTRPRQPGQTEMEYQMRNWYYFVWLCGDHIDEQHIHNIDVINWVKDAHPVSAQGMGGRQVRTSKEHGEIYDHHFVEFEYSDGSRLYSQCRHIPGCWNSVSEYCTGTKGSADINRYIIRGENSFRHNGRGDKNPYQQEHDDLFAAIRNNTPYNEAEYGANSSMSSILGRMCTYTGKMISWDEAINSEVNTMPEVLDWDANPPTLPNEEGFYPIAMPGIQTEKFV
jgi:predicted dehydrogenase